MSPRAVPARCASPPAPGATSCTEDQKVRSIVIPPSWRSHMHSGDGAAGTGDARHLADALVRVAHERDHELGERGVERAVLPRERLGPADAHVGAGVALAAGVGELRRRVDRRHALGAGARGELVR